MDEDFATLSNTTPSQSAASAASGSGQAASAGAGGSGMVWDKPQAFALHNYVVSLLELQGGRDDNQSMWEDVAAKSDLWGSCKPTASELKQVYDQVRVQVGVCSIVVLQVMLFCVLIIDRCTIHVVPFML